MKVSGIDADFVELINELVANGFKPFASCDGVDAHHTEENPATYAYIAFMNSPKVVDLMAAFFRDKDVFSISIGTPKSNVPEELYGNMIEGNRFAVDFENKKGQYTEYFKRIIDGLIDGSISISDEEKDLLERLVAEMDLFKESDLSIDFMLNTTYQPYMNKSGKTNVLRIHTKEDAIPVDEVGENGERYIGIRDMNVLSKLLGKKFGLQTYDIFDSREFTDKEFLVTIGRDMCEFYISEENVEKVFEVIAEIRALEGGIPIVKVIDPDSVDYEDLEDYPSKPYVDEIDI